MEDIMKKALLVIILTAGFLSLFAWEEMVWCKRLLMDEASIHTIQKDETLSRISQHYYGDARYWRQLALINRAPDSDLVFPGEHILIPDQETMQKLSRSRSLTSVNAIVANVKAILDFNEPVEPALPAPSPEPQMKQETSAQPVPRSKISPAEQTAGPVPSENGIPWFVWAMGVIALVALGWLGLRVRQRRQKSTEDDIDSERETTRVPVHARENALAKS
jgi:hypothetical protein